MKILYLCHTTLLGGADFERSRQLGMSLARQGHSVRMIAASGGRGWRWHVEPQPGGLVVETPPDVFPYRLRQAGLSPMDVLARLIHTRGASYDVVHLFGHRPAAYFPAAALRRSTDARLVADWSDQWGSGGLADRRTWWGRRTLGVLDDRWERASRLGADGLTVVSRYLAARGEAWGVPADRILPLGLGSNTAQIRPGDKREARRRNGLAPDTPLVFYGGQSRFDWPLAREAILAVMLRDADVGVLLVGRQSEAMRQGLDPAYRRRALTFGYVSQARLGELLACADVVLLPFPDEASNRARLPNRLGDSMAAARPVVSNKVGEVGEIIKREGIGLAVEAAPQAMAEALVELIEDPRRAERMGHKARSAAEDRYAWPVLAERVSDFYQRLTAS